MGVGGEEREGWEEETTVRGFRTGGNERKGQRQRTRKQIP